MRRTHPPEDGRRSSEGALRRRLESRGYTIERYTYTPRTGFAKHRHEVDRVCAVISGRMKVEMGGQRYLLGPGDIIEMPAGVEHATEVFGDEPLATYDGFRTAQAKSDAA